jgi:hypothetical protein
LLHQTLFVESVPQALGAFVAPWRPSARSRAGPG